MKNGCLLGFAVMFSALGSPPFFPGQQNASSSRSDSRISASPTDYVDSRLCAACHSKIYETYQRTGMARSFYRPAPANTVENDRVNNRYYHAASDTHFEMIARGGKFYQRRYQTGFQGEETNIDEKQIDYVMGSGNHVRTYLHQTARGALLELPLAWYAEKGGYWAMNPGYDKPDQVNSRRKIDYECMFCHNGYPEAPAGSTQALAEPLFREALPEGIDCQRCHGPGRRHVQLARAGSAGKASAIVNPARLTPARRMEVCMQCHLETESMPFAHAIFKYGRGPFSYRAGAPLSDFVLFFDHAPASPSEDRFQIVNSVYRLEQSACFRKSNGALECTTCHNPHDIPRGAAATKAYDAACLGCHSSALRTSIDSARHTASSNCAQCHMPKRRTSDVVQAVMTDHLIQRRKPDRDLLAEVREPLGPEMLYHGAVLPYYPKPARRTAEDELYLATAQVREDNNPETGIPRLASAINKYRPTEPGFYIELGDARLRHGKPKEAAPSYETAVRLKSDSLAGWVGLGRAREASGQRAEAIEAFRRATQAAPTDPLAWRELGETLVRQGEMAEGVEALGRSLQLDAEAPEAHYALGLAWSQPGGASSRAEKAFREAIRLAPDYPEAHMNLAILLFQTQRADEAGFHFERALRYRPDYPLAHLNYGLMLTKLNRRRDAESHLRKAAASSDAAIRDAAVRLLNEARN